MVEKPNYLKKKKKDFASEWKRCTLTSLDRVRSSSLNLLSSETPKSIALQFNDSKYNFSRIKQIKLYNGEFDPGSGRTLAACLTHASQREATSVVSTWRKGE